MAYLFKLPDVGEGMAEGEVVQWFVKEGDTVTEEQPLFELQNDKLLQEIPSPVAGVIKKILVGPNTVAQVGTPLVEIETGDASHAEALEAAPEVKADTAVEVKAEAKVETPAPAAKPEGLQKVLAMPSVRRYAHEKGADLSQVTGTGNRGHIRKEDVDQFLAGGGAVSTPEVSDAAAPEAKAVPAVQAVPVTTAEGLPVERVKMTGMRRAIAKAMVTSKHTAPHVTLFDEVQVDGLVEHRGRYKEAASAQGIKLTYLPYITKAVISVLKKYPELNASIDDTTDEIVYKHYYNMGIAVDTPHGLFVPTVKNVDRKGIYAIAKEIDELAKKANDRSLSAAEMKDGTFSISNIGSARGAWFTPIINYPEVAILGVGSIVKKPVVLEDGTLGVGNVLSLSLSFDHRIIDGKTAQLAMNELKRLLHDIELLMMEG